MILADGALGLLLVGLWIFCIIDVITTDEVVMRNLPKPMWLLIVIFLFDLGAILWLIAGRPWQQTAGRPAGAGGSSAFPEYDRPGRFAATNPDDDEDFLRQVRERAEEQRRRYSDQQTEARRLEEQDQQRRREQRSTDDGDA
ncbi:MAG TPA: PLD nuclease N-terminal domain-containing protein [Nocardioidaceae bacterium]|nr:PLD nuclease N-terminal domain-containing protein [Nocardioidaceae bacterium]